MSVSLGGCHSVLTALHVLLLLFGKVYITFMLFLLVLIFFFLIINFQNLHLKEDVVDRIQTANIRFCGSPDVTLARLRGVLPFGMLCSRALTFSISSFFHFFH